MIFNSANSEKYEHFSLLKFSASTSNTVQVISNYLLVAKLLKDFDYIPALNEW